MALSCPLHEAWRDAGTGFLRNLTLMPMAANRAQILLAFCDHEIVIF